MEVLQIQFTSMDDMKRFIDVVSHYTFDIDLQSGNRVVDGKSMLGLLSIGIHRILKMSVYGEVNQEFIDRIQFCICK